MRFGKLSEERVNRYFMRKVLKKYFGSSKNLVAGGMLCICILLAGCKNDNTEFLAAEEPSLQVTEVEEESTEKIQITKVPETIFVDVCGAVTNPGVYELEADSRVFQAIEAAGGFLESAACEYVNRAESLKDGQQVYIPTRDEAERQEIPVMQQAGQQQDTKVNLNTAGKEELMTLTGIGESKAEAIIAYREDNGGFTVKEDILNVQGIKEGTYEKIKEDIVVE